MKKLFVLTVLSLGLFLYYGCAGTPKPDLTEQVKNEMRNDAKEFMGNLKSVLMSQIQKGGAASAVNVCYDTAQAMAVNYGAGKGIYIKRVSFNNRNSNNVPDVFESNALNHFEQLKSEGKLDEASEVFEVVENKGSYMVRFVKPIMIQAPCLTCHGPADKMNKEVKAAIDSKYPDDKAVGYSVNDLRGVISLKKAL